MTRSRNILAALLLAASCGPGHDQAKDDPAPAAENKPKPLTFATKEEAPHLVAFVKMKEKRLYVLKEQVLKERISAGKWRMEWAPGMTTATLYEGETAVELAVTLLAAGVIVPAHDPPQEGDIRDLELFRKRTEHQRYVGDCKSEVPFIGPATTQSYRFVEPFWVQLTGTGEISAPERMLSYQRQYNYKVQACAGEYLGHRDAIMNWMTERGPWPNP